VGGFFRVPYSSKDTASRRLSTVMGFSNLGAVHARHVQVRDQEIDGRSGFEQRDGAGTATPATPDTRPVPESPAPVRLRSRRHGYGLTSTGPNDSS